MKTLEVLITGEESVIGTACVQSIVHAARRAGLQTYASTRFRGGANWLALFGVGGNHRNQARYKQIAQKGLVACWDLGYVGAGKDRIESYLRVSVNHNHPTLKLMDHTPIDSARWNMLGVKLRDDYHPDGPVIVAGMGPKSRAHLKVHQWEVRTLQKAAERFGRDRIIYRPKPQGNYDNHIDWALRDNVRPIEEVLKGASLVICRHSNVAVNACIAGIPVECEDGIAYWLYRNNPKPSVQQRLDFLCRMAHWQWRIPEMELAWKFLLKVCESRSAVGAIPSLDGSA